MQITIPFPEAVAIASAVEPLPPVIHSLSCEGSTVDAELDLGAIPDAPSALRFAAAFAGIVAVTARMVGYSDGIATVSVTAHARALPAHKLLPYLLGPINDVLRKNGLPEGLVQIKRTDTDPLVLIDVQTAVETKATGVTVTALDLRDAIVHLEARIGQVRLPLG